MNKVNEAKRLIAETDYTGRFKKDVDLEIAKLVGCSYSLVAKLRAGHYNKPVPLRGKRLAKVRCLERNTELGRRVRRV